MSLDRFDPAARRLAWIGIGLVLLIGAGLAVHKPGAGNPGSEERQAAFVAIGIVAAGLYFMAAALVLKPGAVRGRRAIWLVLAVAMAMRLGTLAGPAFLSSDVYRYIWDGRVQQAGLNPYARLPADPELRALRDGAIYPHINRADYAPTIYPPMAQMIFRAVTAFSETPLAMKLAMTGFDLLAIAAMLRLLAIAGLPPSRVLIYAWNPLVVWEFAGNAHVDAAVVGFVGLAMLARVRGRTAVAAALLAAAVLVKFLPAALFPAFWRGRDWRTPVTMLVVIAASYSIYIGAGWRVVGFLPGYLAEENLDGGNGIYWLDLLGHFVVLPAIAGRVWLGCAAAALLSIAAWMMFFRDETPSLRLHPATVARDVAILSTAVVLAVTPHYPWYFAWLALPSCLAPSASVIFLSVAAIIQYHDPFHDPALQFSFIYLPFLLLAWRDLRRRNAPFALARSL